MTGEAGQKGAIDSRSFEILVREYHRRVLAYALSLVRNKTIAEDLVQDAFVTAYRKLDTFDPSCSFGAWIRGITRNKYLEWRKARREVPLDEAALDALDATHLSWDEAAQEGKPDVFTMVEDCLARLSELLHRTIHLYYFEGRSCRDIAKNLDSEEATVRQRLQRGREMLGTCIKGKMLASV